MVDLCTRFWLFELTRLSTFQYRLNSYPAIQLIKIKDNQRQGKQNTYNLNKKRPLNFFSTKFKDFDNKYILVHIFQFKIQENLKTQNSTIF